MIFYGAGGHAKVALDVAVDNGETIEALFDEDQSKKMFCGIQVHHKYSYNLFHNHTCIITIGNNQIRERISKTIGHSFGILRHSSVITGDNCTIDEGTLIYQGAVIQHSTKIGKHVIINTSASIDHDCIIGSFAHIGPNSTLCGNVSIGSGTLIGAGSTIIPGVSIGTNCIIGAGSVVIEDIPDNVMAYGNPCKISKLLI